MSDVNGPDGKAGPNAEGTPAGDVRRDTSGGPISTLLGVLLGLGVWGMIGASIAAIFSQTARDFFSSQWKWILLSFAVTVAAALLVRSIEKITAKQSPTARRATLALVVLPLIVLSVIAIVFMASAYQAFMVEVVFVMVVCLVPGAMYYLFIATRRPSILNEFITSLSRLGLFDTIEPQPVVRPGMKAVQEEYPDERRARVQGYFQKFEAVYGELRFEDSDGSYMRENFVDNLLAAVELGAPAFASGRLPRATVRISDILKGNQLLPLGLATALSSLGWLLVLQPEWNALAELAILKETAADPAAAEVFPIFLQPQWTPVNFAFLGAYFFGLQMLFRRFVRRDLGSNAYLAFSLRILLAVIASWVVIAGWAALTKGVENVPEALQVSLDQETWPPALLVVTFAIGVFPRMIWQVISAVFVKIAFLKLALPAIASKQPLSDLDGLTIWHEARLEEEDVENVPNMATTDVVDLLLHTQFPPERVIAWVDEAILHRVLGPDSKQQFENTRRGKLRHQGIGNATEFVCAYLTCDDDDRVKLDAVLESSESTPSPMRTIFRTIQLEPNYNLVRSWRRLA